MDRKNKIMKHKMKQRQDDRRMNIAVSNGPASYDAQF